jgi:hypothetical protein
MKSLNLSFAQRMRSRHAIKEMLDWAREKNYLPPLLDKQRNLIPWKSSEVEFQANLTLYNPKKIFEAYFDHLQECDRIDASRRIKSVMLRTFIPALNGPQVQGKKADNNDLEMGLRFLEKVSSAQLWEIYYEKTSLEGSAAQQTTNRHIFREMLDWACSVGYLEYPEPEYKEEVQFNFFQASPGQAKKPLSQPSQEKKSQCETHTLGTFDFELNCIKPLKKEDSINPKLEKQLIEYKNWRIANGVAKGGLKSEINQVLQILGWLYRHKKIPLEDLRLEKFIWKFQLIISVSDDSDMDEHYKNENKLLRIAQQQGDTNKQLIEEYLKFRGGSPASKQRYVALSIAIAKFVYEDTLYTDQFSSKESIPILRRLLALQVQAKKERQNTPNVCSYEDSSVSWTQAILLVEHRRVRSDKTITHNRIGNRALVN